MITIKNFEEMMEEDMTAKLMRVFPREAVPMVKCVMEDSISVLESEYGVSGSGGYVCVLEDSVEETNNHNEYRLLLDRYGLEKDDSEICDLIYSNDDISVYFQLFVITDFNLMVVYKEER